jgi:hypothetical protein
MGLKQPAYARVHDLPTTAYARTQDPTQKKQNQETATRLLVVFAALADAIASGTVSHVTLGLPRNRKAFLVTVNYAGEERAYVGGDSLDDLAYQLAVELIDETGGGDGGPG